MHKSDPSRAELRALPHSEDAEKGLLCSLCLDPELLARLPTLPAGFWYFPNHRIICEAVRQIIRHSDPLDFISLKTYLLADQQFDEVGGIEYLDALWTFVPSAAHWEYYYDIVFDRYIRRVLIADYKTFMEMVYDEKQDVPEGMAKLAEKFLTRMALMVSDPPKVFREQVHQTLDFLAEQEDTGKTGIRFGIKGLDNALYGLRNSELCGIGAKSSDGKSALLLNLACYAADHDIPAAIFSLEMPDVQQITRIFALESGIDLNAFRRARLGEVQYRKLIETAERIMPWKMHIEDCAHLTFDSFCSRCRALRVKHGVRLFGLDMISLLSVPKAERYDLALANVIQGCKNLALELNAVIVVLTQLNEQLQTKNSKAIFEACDVFLRITKVDDDSENDAKKDILIEKNRMGPRGVTVPVTFDGPHMRFTDRLIRPLEEPPSFSPHNDD